MIGKSCIQTKMLLIIVSLIIVLKLILDVYFVSSAPVECHARVGGHPVPVALIPWIPAFAGMTTAAKLAVYF